jgi:hypothetical protein
MNTTLTDEEYKNQSEEYKETQYQLHKNDPLPPNLQPVFNRVLDYNQRYWRDKMREVGPIVYKEQPPFDYERYNFFKKENLPEFIRFILDHPFLPDEEKHKFADHFIMDYLYMPGVKEEMEGKHIVFVNKKYIDSKIFANYSQIAALKTNDNTVLSIPIHEIEPEPEFGRFTVLTLDKITTSQIIEFINIENNEIEDSKEFFTNRHYKVDCLMSHLLYQIYSLNDKHYL